MKKSRLLVAFLVFSSALLLTLAYIPEARATTLYVGGMGPANYTAVQDAIDNATAGYTIYVYNGTYYENVVVDKPLSLVGENRDTTVIDGGESDTVVSITSDWVNITGFTLTNGGLETVNPGINLGVVNNCSITGNTVTYNGYGIRIRGSGHVVANNTVNNNTYGIVLSWASNNSLSGNSMNRRGILIEGQALEHFASQTIDVSNTVKGKPIRYWKNVIGGTIPTDAGQVILANCTNVTVKNQNISDVTMGVRLGFSSNNAIVNNTISNCTWGIFLGASNDNLIEHNVISSNSYQGIRLDSSRRNNISQNALLDNYGTHVDLFTGSHENVISENTLSNGARCFDIYESHNNTVAHNNASHCRVCGVRVMYSDGTKITNNTLPSEFDMIGLHESDNTIIVDNVGSSTQNGGIGVGNSVHATLHNNTVIPGGMAIGGTLLEHWNTHIIDTSNTVNGKPVYYWKNLSGGIVPLGAGHVTLANCSNVTIEGQNMSDGYVGMEAGFSPNTTIANNIATNEDNGIYVYSSNGSQVSNNTVLGGGWGITISLSEFNTVSNNTASDNRRDGIVSWYAGWNTIHNNTVSGNGWYGIEIQHSNRNIISENEVTSSGREGLTIQSSDSNKVFNNTIFFNPGIGIGVYYSDGNRLYHNNIIENGNQAYDHFGFNPWWDSYPNGGNYWSDYTGIDQRWGPNQDQPGSDGIGDTPYVIDADSRDAYPLMSPTRKMKPRPPGNLRADLLELQNVTLTWSLSPDDLSGFMSVVNYQVYRGTAYDSEGLMYQLLATLPNGTSVYTDNYSGEGNPNSYFYRVCAVDQFGNLACAGNQAAKFTRPLMKGSNLISIPLIQSNESIETVLQTVKWNRAWSYDSLSQEWKSYMKQKTYKGNLSNVNHTMGLWVNVTEDSNLTVAGIVPTQTTMHLHKGWNLVSFPSFDTANTVAALKAEIGATRVEGYDLVPPYFMRVLGDFEVLETGYAYWVRVNAAVDWIVEVS